MKFTVAIPAFKAKFLKESIDSVLGQTYPDFELIVVNDASPEDIESIVAQYPNDRISYYRNGRNLGSINVVDNWNVCLSYAKGDYFILMGDDDKMYPEYLQEFAELIEKYPQCCVYNCRTLIIDEHSNPVEYTEPRPAFESVYDCILERIRGHRKFFISDYVYQTAKLRSTGGFFKLPLAWASDDISAYIAARSAGIAYTNKPVFMYRRNAQSLSVSGNDFLKMDAVLLEEKWFMKFLQQPADNFSDNILRDNIQAELKVFVQKKKMRTIYSSAGSFIPSFIKWFRVRGKYELSLEELIYAFILRLKEGKTQIQQMSKPIIAWVTPDYFIDCDFNPEILANLLQTYEIRWIILLPRLRARISESDFDSIRTLPGLQLEFIYWNCRERSPKMLAFYETVYRRTQDLHPAMVYFNYVPSNPYLLPVYWRLARHRTVFTAHDGAVKSSFKMAWLSKLVFKLAFSSTSNVHMFSRPEASLFADSFPKTKIFRFPLALKDFGPGKVQKRKDTISFLFFGSINSNKNLELLIDAACNIYEQGMRGFKIVIKGHTDAWPHYAARIRYPDLFECDIRFYKNSEIADIFSAAHYAVFPYKEVSQSGALKVAFNYSLPVIVSDLAAFTDEVDDGINGFQFKSESVSALELAMKNRLRNHKDQYHLLTEQVKAFNNKHYSPEVLSDSYRAMFQNIISTSSSQPCIQ